MDLNENRRAPTGHNRVRAARTDSASIEAVTAVSARKECAEHDIHRPCPVGRDEEGTCAHLNTSPSFGFCRGDHPSQQSLEGSFLARSIEGESRSARAIVVTGTPFLVADSDGLTVATWMVTPGRCLRMRPGVVKWIGCGSS